MKYATIVPLIGGLTVANKQITGKDPEVFLSYSAFGDNEKNAIANFPGVPHVLIDAPGFDPSKYTGLDFISAVCPCAGLSMLSRGGVEQKAKMNSWMIQTAELVTGTLRPKVFWGENAPALATKSGEDVRQQLREIGQKNGYRMSIYATNTALHGIPQIRKRTFYFFWRDTCPPIFEFYNKPKKTFGQYLTEVPFGVEGQRQSDIDKATEYLNIDPYFQYLESADSGLENLRKYLKENEINTLTLSHYIQVSKQIDKALTFFDDNGHQSAARELRRVKEKTESGGGIWDGSISVFNPDMDFLALVHRKLDSVHPYENRIFTPRECMHLMGLPNTFNLVTNELNHVCQNVPVCTGADMTSEVIAVLEGKRELSTSEFLLQNNHNKTVVQEYAKSKLFEY